MSFLNSGPAVCQFVAVTHNLFCCLHAQCADGKVEALSDTLQATVAKWKARIPMPVPLELYTSSTFIGLFVEEQVAEVLKGFAADFASEAAAKAGLIPHCLVGMRTSGAVSPDDAFSVHLKSSVCAESRYSRECKQNSTLL